MLPTDADFEKTNLVTTAKVGKLPTPESIRQGTVWMEYHPDYDAAIQKAKNAGFEIRKSGFASVEWIEVYDKDRRDRNLLRIEKVLHVLENMRYLDLEHELGHIDQFSRFGNQVPPTDKMVELPNGRRKRANIQDGVLTTAQSTAAEYHNRLVEFIRLYERGVDMEVLVEHADGVDDWDERYRKKLRGKRNHKMPAWVKKYFGEIDDLVKQYNNIKQSLGI
ncbi:MAG: hypothetical protein ACPGWR_09955 [Ardenticatenaceae bacterium]